MSDRRERVARAIYATVSTRFLDPGLGLKWHVITGADPVFPTWDTLPKNVRNDYLADADAALAVIDAEPTEAEVEAAVDRLIQAVADDTRIELRTPELHGQWSIDNVTTARHAVLSLIAARKEAK